MVTGRLLYILSPYPENYELFPSRIIMYNCINNTLLIIMILIITSYNYRYTVEDK
ncbi:MAG: hypothetical protein HeimC2_28030 [Candidatus Heimdallarchaeota archaeon LC_2]|nr:MAG: hypothetical protein HeimC2_28030 [Candidatus Heimdallarchaeota archaeon LC_2]